MTRGATCRIGTKQTRIRAQGVEARNLKHARDAYRIPLSEVVYTWDWKRHEAGAEEGKPANPFGSELHRETNVKEAKTQTTKHTIPAGRSAAEIRLAENDTDS